jgi:hypothetical protein
VAEWVAAAEPVAYGELRLTYAEFNTMTPHEFLLRLDGHRRLERQAWRRTATLGAWILAPWAKKPHSARELLGWKTDDGEDEES